MSLKGAENGKGETDDLEKTVKKETQGKETRLSSIKVLYLTFQHVFPPFFSNRAGQPLIGCALESALFTAKQLSIR